MKRLIIILWILIPNALLAQNNIREAVFSHLSSSELLAGETLYFKNYVYGEHSGRLSNLSQILYIEILNESGSPVYQTKLLINKGQCFGQFFIPTDFETGTYQFVAYTRWMKNFEQFFLEKIVIINPYIHQKFHSVPEQEMNVQITVEGGHLLAKAKNRLVLRVTDQFGQGFKAKGKIVSNKEKEAIEVITDDFGFFNFYIKPDLNESFQLIMENGQGFEFIDLPKPCVNCNQVRVIQTADLFVVKSSSSDSEELTQGKVDIFKNQENIFSSPVVLNTAFSILKKDLTKGLLRLVYTDSEGEISERLIWNGKKNAHQDWSLQDQRANNDVDVIFPVVPAARLSISIEQIDTTRETLGVFWYTALSRKIDLNLPNSFYRTATEDQLDNMLLSSKYIYLLDNPEEVALLPEYRSGIVQGKITNERGAPLSNLPVGLAFSGVNRQLSATISDSLGRFVLTYDPAVSHGEPVVDLLTEVANVQISIEPEFYSSYPKFANAPIVFDSSKVAEIVKRSINNQIMNAYFIAEKEKEPSNYIPQFDQVKTYKLDNYTRFATMRDTFIELIVEVGVSKNEDKHEFKMRSQDLVNGFYEEYPTLLLLDGAFVSSEDLMNLSPYLVDRIDIINHKYYFGKSIFDGILSVHTVAKDRGEIEPKGLKVDLVPVEKSQKQIANLLSNSLNVRIPAFQDLLYWNPTVSHTGGALEIDFTTSEVKGLFEIRVEGVSDDGNAISEQLYFTVD